MSRYRLTERADRDLIEIYLYTIENFGFARAEEYVQSITWCFNLLVDNPRLGRAADDVRRGIRRHEHGSHVIFYREDGSDLLILAVIHRRMRPDLL